jgi:chromosome segregation ATPase
VLAGLLQAPRKTTSVARLAKLKDTKAQHCKQIQAKICSLAEAISEAERDLAGKRAALKRGSPFASDADKEVMGSEISEAVKRAEGLRQRRAGAQAKLGQYNEEFAAIVEELKDVRNDLAERQALGECVKFVQKRGVDDPFQRTSSNSSTGPSRDREPGR